MNQKFSNQYRAVLQRAQALAEVGKESEIRSVHLLEALLQTKGSIAFELMHKLGLVQPTQVKVAGQAAKSEINTPQFASFSSMAKKIIKQSVLIAAQNDHQYVSTEHLLQGLLREDQELMKSFLVNRQYSLEDFDNQLSAVMRNTSKFGDLTASFSAPEFIQPQSIKNKKRRKSKTKTPPKESLLDFFATELTATDQHARLKPVVGRQAEIERIIQILARFDKNNPVLLGQPGVGKTAIIEGLAKKIVACEVPDILLNKKIYNLDLSLLVAGAMYRGEFESRLRQLIDEIQEDDDIIIFIDEIHNLVGAGSATGTMDAANILKPALARGDLRLIGATTFDEYKKHIETDSALERRLQPVIVAEPSVEETVSIIKGIRGIYEGHHGVKILNEAIEAATDLSHRYLTEKYLPDKAIDLIDEAAAKVKVKQGHQGEQRAIYDIERQIQALADKKRCAVESENFPMALAMKEEERVLIDKLEQIETKEKEKVALRGKITNKEIADLVSQITGIPVGDMMSTEVKRLLDLDQKLNRRIIGQIEAIEILAQAIKRSKTGLSQPDKPLGSFIFLGPTGVGKTETAKVLAEEVFGSSKSLIRFDMSEFVEGFNISRLIGSPPGYVGYKEGGQLTEKVRRQPYSVVLFDEIEKAHPEIFNTLLQILDGGYLTDATGKRVDFRNTIIILTSNVGLHEFNRGAEIGFGSEADIDKQAEARQEYAKIRDSVLGSLKKSFRPEFLNRLDKTVVFKPLTLGDIKKIVSIEMQKSAKQAKENKLVLKADTKFVKFMAEKSFTPQEGARVVKRKLQDLVMSPLADKLLSGDLKKNTPIKLTIKDDKLVFEQE